VKTLLAAFLLASGFLASTARAESVPVTAPTRARAAGTIREYPPATVPHLEARTSERSGSFALKAGPYVPTNILSRTPDATVKFSDLYGKGSGIMFGAEWEWQPLHHRYYGALGFGAGADFWQRSGKALKEDGTVSVQSTKFMLIPAKADMTYRLEIWPDQPLVPFAGVGFDYWYFSEKKTTGIANEVSGAKSGWHWRVGGEFLLDVFDQHAAGDMDRNWGINNTYLFAEYRAITITNFNRGSGFDFSANTWAGGLLFEY
jgi:hypothetical protein